MIMKTTEAFIGNQLDEHFLSSQVICPVIENVPYPQSLLKTSQTVDSISFMEIVEAWNVDRIKILMKKLASQLMNVDPNLVAVLLIGSDARREKGPYSAFEFIVLSPNQNVAQYVRKKILDISCQSDCRGCQLTNCQHISTSNHDIEIKIRDDQYLSSYNGDPKHLWPDRILSSQIVYGSPKLLVEAREKVIQEVLRNPLAVKQVRQQKNRFLRTTETGRSSSNGNTIVHFDPITGIMYHDPNNYIRGPKYGPIRAVQTHLTIEQVNRGLVNLDPNTLNKLSFIYSDGHLGEIDTAALAKAYAQAQYYYHLLQAMYHEGNNKFIQFEIDPKIMVSISNTIIRALSSGN